MAWATTTQIRLISGLSTTDISDANVTSIITLADREVAKYVFEYHYAQALEGVQNGSNTLFQTPFKPIGDKDQSGTIDDDDVSVYGINLNAQGHEV